MEKVRGFKDLTVWKKSHELVLMIYTMTRTFPKEEKFGLVSQMRRAAVSVPGNIVEGFKKRGRKDKINYYNIAQGSLNELAYYILLSKDLGYIQSYDKVKDLVNEVGRMLTKMMSSAKDYQIKESLHTTYHILHTNDEAAQTS